MSQRDIVNILKGEPDRWFTYTELSDILRLNESTITTNVARLVKAGEVERCFLPYLTGLKHRTTKLKV